MGAIAEGMRCIRPPSETRKNRIKTGRQMESLFCLQLKFLRLQMSQTVTRQRLLKTFFGLAVEFLYELLCWQIKGNFDCSTGSWRSGTGF